MNIRTRLEDVKELLLKKRGDDALEQCLLAVAATALKRYKDVAGFYEPVKNKPNRQLDRKQSEQFIKDELNVILKNGPFKIQLTGDLIFHGKPLQKWLYDERCQNVHATGKNYIYVVFPEDANGLDLFYGLHNQNDPNDGINIGPSFVKSIAYAVQECKENKAEILTPIFTPPFGS
jgi:hypothetical protein